MKNSVDVEVKKVIEEICYAEIYEMTALGDLKVSFSTLMLTEFIELEWLNSTVIDIYIIPADGR